MRKLIVLWLLTLALPLLAQTHHVFAGDSITQGTGACSISTDAQTWPAQAMPLSFFAGGTRHMAATAGWTTTDLITDYAVRVAPYKPNGSTIATAYLLVFIGTNDVHSLTASQIETNLKSYWATARADGFKVVAFTVPDNGQAVGWNVESTRTALNTLIRADGAYWDYLVDAAGFAEFQGTGTDTYKCDGTHFTAGGLTLFAQKVNTALAPSVTLNGTSYTLKSHPRLWVDATKLADPDGAGAQTAPNAVSSNPAWVAATGNVATYTTGNAYQTITNRSALKSGDVVLNAALAWYGDNSQIAARDMALWLLNGVEQFIPLMCDPSQQGCGQSNYGAESYGVTYWMPNWAQAYSLMQAQMTTAERQAFAAKMLNDHAAWGGINGSAATTCTDPTVRDNTLTFTGTSASVITTNHAVFGTAINVGDWVMSTGGGNYPARVVSIQSSTQATLDTGTSADGAYVWNNATPTVLYYRAQTFSPGDCGWFWYAKHERFNPNSIIGYPNTPQYSDGGIYGADGVMNLVVAGYRGMMAALLALADDDPNASTRALPQLTALYNAWYAQSYTPATNSFTMYSNNGSGYGRERAAWTTMTALEVTRSVQSSPALLGTMGRNLMTQYYMAFYPSFPNAYIQFGQQGVDGAWFINGHVGDAMALVAAYPGTPEAAYLQYFLQSAWTNQNSGYGQLWDAAHAGLTSTNFARNGGVPSHIYLFYDPAATATNLTTAPLAVAPTAQSGANGLRTLVSRTGFTSLTDTVVAFYGHNVPSGYDTDHGNPYNPGSYKIIKAVPLLSEDEGGAGSVTNLTNNALSGYWQQSNYIQLGADANISPSNGINVTMPRAVTSDNRFAYGMVDASQAYLAGANASRVHRHLLDFKSGQQFVVEYSDVVLTAGKTIKGFYHYVNNGQTGEGATTLTSGAVTSSFPGTGKGDAVQLLTKFLAPGTLAAIGEASYAGGNGQTYRVTACASTDGATCASATTAEWATVHMPVVGTSNTLPATALLATIDGNHRGVQIDGSAPKVAIFPRNGQTYTSATFTSTHSGTAQIAVTGLAAGNYSVSGPVTLAAQTVDSNGVLYFEGAAGSYSVTQTGITTYTVTCNVVGSGTCTGAGTYSAGSTATLTQAAGSGNNFVGWSGACSGTSGCSLTVTANATVTATFAPIPGVHSTAIKGLRFQGIVFEGHAPATVSTPTFSPVAGIYSATQNVTITSATSGAAVQYCADTNNTCTPTTSYTAPVAVTATGYLRARASKSGMITSAIASAPYTITTAGMTVSRPSTSVIASDTAFLSPAAAYDNNLGTSATGVNDEFNALQAGQTWSGFGSVAGPFLSANLNVRHFNNRTSVGVLGTIAYSLNGGATWTTLFNGTDAVATTTTAAIPLTQDLTQVQVRALTALHETIDIYEIWIEVTK